MNDERRHELTLYPIPQHKGWRFGGDCSCGWSSPSCSTELRVFELHAEQTGAPCAYKLKMQTWTAAT